MCGRFTCTVSPEELYAIFSEARVPVRIGVKLTPRYNIAPSQEVAVVANREEKRVEFFRWGLIPAWAKDPAIGYKMINARAETLAQKAAFRTAYKKRRCLVLADGFYEWKREAGKKTKTPMLVRLKSGQPLGFAGLWEEWRGDKTAPLFSCTIITTDANSLVEPIHDRMPVILKPEDYKIWLSTEEVGADRLDPLLTPYAEKVMTAYPVSTMVNSPKNDSPECVEPVE
jgi:putative SOS response-associated peptidase YedK